MRKLLVLSLLFLSFGALAATNDTAEVKPQLSDKITMPIWPKVGAELKEQEVVEVSFRPGNIADIDSNLLKGVTFKGYARKVAVEDRQIGQVLATSVSKEDKEVAISATGFSAQFDAKETPEITEDKSFEVEGSKAELLAALEKLNSNEKEDEEKEEETPTKGVGNNDADGEENEMAAGYKTPAKMKIDEKEDPVVEMKSTKDGCEIRVDVAQGVAIEQTKTQTLTDGVVTEDGECSDSEVRYLLKDNVCENLIDIASMTAYPQKKQYYIDTAGFKHEIGECMPDNSKAMAVSEEISNCTPDFDYNENKVVFNTALVYTDQNGVVVQARGCEPSTTIPSVALKDTTDGCNLRNDFENKKTYEMAMKVYKNSGQVLPATGCTDTGIVYDQKDVYGVCPPIDGEDSSKVTLQYRRQIIVDGVPQFVSGCRPDEHTTDVVATTEGCEIRHDINAGISYEQIRHYYFEAGRKKYVTTCQDSDVSFAHDVEIVGYEYHDDQRFAYPKMKVTINTASGVQTVANSIVLEGSAKLPYVLEDTKAVPTGEPRYEGCNEFRDTVVSEVYKRPDDSFYNFPTGAAGEPEGPRDACSETIQTRTYNRGGLWADGYRQEGTRNYAITCSQKVCNCGYTEASHSQHQGESYIYWYYKGNAAVGELVTEQRIKKTNPLGEVFYGASRVTGSSPDCSIVKNTSGGDLAVQSTICGKSSLGYFRTYEYLNKNYKKDLFCNYSAWR
jgi:hypothetical protein